MDLREQRELRMGAGDALNRAMELTITPLIMGLLGYLLDDWLGTRPIFTVLLFAIALSYIVWKNVTVYRVTLEREQQRALRGERGVDG